MALQEMRQFVVVRTGVREWRRVRSVLPCIRAIRKFNYPGQNSVTEKYVISVSMRAHCPVHTERLLFNRHRHLAAFVRHRHA